MEDIFKNMATWSGRRIEELQSWKRHHQTQIEKLDEEISKLKSYDIDYEEFMKKINRPRT